MALLYKKTVIFRGNGDVDNLWITFYMEHGILWSLVEKELGKKLPAHAINTWFDPIRSVALSSGELVLEVPNQFFLNGLMRTTTESLKGQLMLSQMKKQLSSSSSPQTILNLP